MIRMEPGAVTQSIRSVFRIDDPQSPRCFAVLDGVASHGEIYLQRELDPEWAIVIESGDNTLFLGGCMEAQEFRQAFEVLGRNRSLLVGLWDGDARMQLLPEAPQYDGRTLEFYQRRKTVDLISIESRLPEKYVLRRIDHNIVMQCKWGPGDVKRWGGMEIWENRCLGYCVLDQGRVVSEASVGPAALGLHEMGVFTNFEFRRQGLGKIVSARLIREIEAQSGATYWNCAKQNIASAAIARRLGYSVEKEYRCMVWSA